MVKSSLSQQQFKFTMMVAKLILYAYGVGYTLSLGEAWRPQEMQDLYLKTGKTKVKYSKHQDRLAIDLNLFMGGKLLTDKESYRVLGEYWEHLSDENVWGGRFGVRKEDYDKKVGWDPGHFQDGE